MLVVNDVPDVWHVTTERKAAWLAEKLDKLDIFAVDTETTGLNIVRDTPVYASFAADGFRAAVSDTYFPMFKPILENPKKIKVGHNIKYDAHMFANVGINIRPLHDTLVMAIMDDSERSSQELKAVVASIFRPEENGYISYKSPFGGKIKNALDVLRTYGIDTLVDYAALDAMATWNIYNRLKDRLKEKKARGCSLWDLFEKEEAVYTEVLYSCERAGFLLDFDSLNKSIVEAEKSIEMLARKFTKLAGRVVNLNSTPQLRDLFFNHLGKKTKKETKKGAASLDEEVIKEWAAKGDEVAVTLLEYRKTNKLAGTYLKGLSKRSDAYGRVHTTFAQSGAATGRLASRNPNLQNIPRPNNDKFQVRKAFVAPKDHVLIDADYDQLEMMLIADMAQEKNMMAALMSGKDLHATTASEMYNIPYENIAAAKKKPESEANDEEKRLVDLRTEAKTIGFMLNYGGGPGKLSIALGCSFAEAKAKIERYFAVRSGLKSFSNYCAYLAEQQGYVQTISGRWRSLTAATSPDMSVARGISRKAANSVIQGSAADVVRLAMIKCYQDDKLRELGVRMLSQVHDEIIFECPKETAEEACPRIKYLMLLPYASDLDIKLNTDPGIGLNWLEAKG